MQLIVNIVVLAAIYALIACGYVLIYRVSRVLNLAHGELMMLGAYLLLRDRLAVRRPSAHRDRRGGGAEPRWSGVLVYVFLMRKMTGEMVLAAVLTTVALGILLRGADRAGLVGAAAVPAAGAAASPTPPIALPGGARISLCAALLVLTTALVYGGLFAFLRFGRWGVRMRAAGQNPLLAAQRGINLHAIYALAWGLSTLTGCARRHADRARFRPRPDHGRSSGSRRFPPALVGGLDSLVGALVGSLIVAGAEVLLIHYVDPLLSDVVPFLVLIAMLIVRPWGLFGTREELDRV